MALVRQLLARKIIIEALFSSTGLPKKRRQLAWQKEELQVEGWQLPLQLGLKMVQPTHKKLRQMGRSSPQSLS